MGKRWTVPFFILKNRQGNFFPVSRNYSVQCEGLLNCLPLRMFLGCCLSSALRCPRPWELAGTRSYGLDHGASASASMGRCLWEESCLKDAAGMMCHRKRESGPRRSHEYKSKLTSPTIKMPIYQLRKTICLVKLFSHFNSALQATLLLPASLSHQIHHHIITMFR